MATTERDSARVAADVPFVPWREFLPEFMAAWPENSKGKAEHVTIVGPTGQGKSVLCTSLLVERGRVRGSSIVALVTKPRDRTMTALGKQPGWNIIRRWPPGYGQERVLFWPRFGDVRTVTARHAEVFRSVLEDIFHERNRIVYLDEAYYLSDDLGLKDLLTKFWQMGRSQNLILVAGTQRPVAVPRPMFSECSWFIAFRTADRDELRRVSEIGGVDNAHLREVMKGLQPHEFVVVQTRTGNMVRSKVARKRGSK